MEKTLLNLYRSLHKGNFPDGPVLNQSQPAPEILYPDFDKRTLPNGNVRNPDVETEADKNGVRWVKSGGGTSLFDKPKLFPEKTWWSFEIPEGTVVPESLKIIFTKYNQRFDANHYQIESKADMMRLDAFKGALDNLARNAITRAVELGRM